MLQEQDPFKPMLTNYSCDCNSSRTVGATTPTCPRMWCTIAYIRFSPVEHTLAYTKVFVGQILLLYESDRCDYVPTTLYNRKGATTGVPAVLISFTCYGA